MFLKQTHPSAQTAGSSSLWLGSPSHLLRAWQKDREAVILPEAHERACCVICLLSLRIPPGDGQETGCEPSAALGKVSFPLTIWVCPSDRGWGKWPDWVTPFEISIVNDESAPIRFSAAFEEAPFFICIGGDEIWPNSPACVAHMINRGNCPAILSSSPVSDFGSGCMDLRRMHKA